MNDHFRVDPAGLAEAIAELRAFAAWWEQTETKLTTLIEDLHTSWLGQAAAAHKDAYRRWSEGSAQMRDTLTELHRAGTAAGANYSTAGNIGQRMWGRTR